IEHISAIPALDTEIFIHGALCYCYSGLCLLSSVLRGTSGNRGSCEYICRGNYSVHGNGKQTINANIMSMKDLATGDLIASFRKAGVTSLKIEGRKKTPLYVSAVTNYYRHLLDGDFKAGEQIKSETDIRTIFSRPWTPFHYKHRKQLGITDIHTVGHRGTDIGIVTDIVKDAPDRIRFTVKNRVLEKHDGLQVELAERDKPFGFPVNDIRLFPQRNNDTWKNAFEAPADATIEVSLPDEHPEIPIGSRIFCASSQAVKRSYAWETPRPALVKSRIPVHFHLKISPSLLEVSAQAEINSRKLPQVITNMNLDASLSPAKQPERLEDTIRNSFAKLGDTEFEMASVLTDNPDGLYVPVSLLNELRRQSSEELHNALSKHRQKTVMEIQQAFSALPQPFLREDPGHSIQWRIGIDRPFFLNVFPKTALEKIDEAIFYLSRTPEEELLATLGELEQILGDRERIRLALPSICRSDVGYMTESGIATLVNAGYNRWECNNICSIQQLKDAGAAFESLDVTAGWSLFVTNNQAAKALLSQGYKRLMLSPDDCLGNWEALLKQFSSIAEVPAYQDTVLGISDVCAMSSLNEHCPGKATCTFKTLRLSNPRKNENLLAINNNCQTVLLNQQPFNLSGHIGELKRLGARKFRADFCWLNYAPTAVYECWNNLQHDIPLRDAWTANLFR
ncbi:MAG: U32 family peptidase, partial [Victivallales bacterium]|nr:U32 family peptidase [Victivallales bacterium]